MGKFFSLIALAVVALLSGCAVGPDFHSPTLPATAGYTAKPIFATASTADVTGGEEQRFVMGKDIPREWWALFKSKPLNALIETSIKANPTIDAAKAALHVAHEDVLAQKGYYYPAVQSSFSAVRAKDSAALSPVPSNNAEPYSLHTGQVNVSFTPDVFSGNRRQVESLKAQEDFQRFQLDAAYLTLTSNVVATAIQEASLRSQISATQKIIKIEMNMLGQLRGQFKLGYVAGLDVAAQEAALAQVQQTLPPLEQQLAITRDQLKALAGRFPNEELEEKFELAEITLPQDLPLSIPSKLVEQRPDVRAAEEEMHSACAQVGVAVAARLPSFPISANLGSTALEIGKLFSSGTGFWSLAGGIIQPIFDAGTLKHRQRAAEAGLAEAEAQYKSTVLAAFQNVADTLHALEYDADTLKAASAYKQASKRSLDLARERFNLGYVNYLSLLSAEQAYQQAEINLVQAKANRFSDTAALFMALGGGWWNGPDLASAEKETISLNKSN